jgi:hypothetical protein
MHFNEKNDFIIQATPYKAYIPAKFVEMIYWRLQEGIEYYLASNVYDITREQAGFILANYKPRGINENVS